jgi:hypothetical protein
LPTANYAQNINKSHNLSENNSSQAKVEVLILKNSKLKGDRIEKNRFNSIEKESSSF